MSVVALSSLFLAVTLVASVVLPWIGDLRRSGGAVSAREHRVASERARPAFYTRPEDRAEAMRERIRRERRRRERVREAAGVGERRARAAASEAPPRPNLPPPPRTESPEARHRATLELGPGPVTADGLRSAYRRLVAAYHPDRVAGLGAKLQRLAEEETKSINEAYAFFKAHLRD